MPESMTLEQALERIVELTEELQDTRTERDNANTAREEAERRSEELREINQRYFNKLQAQENAAENKKEDEGEDVPTCEEFAKGLTI